MKCASIIYFQDTEYIYVYFTIFFIK